MITLRIQHSVSSYEHWKRAFDADPLDRKGAGVRSYAIHRLVDDPMVVLIDLEFDTLTEARSMESKLRTLWTGRAREIMRNAESRLVETVERVAMDGQS